MSTIGARLTRALGDREPVGMAAITASELLHGVHRATPNTDREEVRSWSRCLSPFLH
jgi:hypothetical protein